MHLEDGLAARPVGQRDADATVKAARAQQSRVQDIGTVGGRQKEASLCFTCMLCAESERKRG
jgi:hypothetical protein